jgi:hypothetical protein
MEIPMNKLVVPALVALSMAAAPAAFAATHPKTSTPAASGKAMSSTAPKTASVDKTKEAACQKQWKAEKKHAQTHKAFMAQCTAKA